MQKIQLKGGGFTLVDDEDFDLLNQWTWYKHTSSARSKTSYAARSVYTNKVSKVILMHRFLLNLNDSNLRGDHIDRDGLNNQKHNLRVVTASQNNANRAASGVSKYLGVYWEPKRSKWVASITANKKIKRLGRFTNEWEAALAYNSAAKEIHGEFANLNKVYME